MLKTSNSKISRFRQKILSRKVITYAIFLLLTLLFTKMCTYPPLSHNPQGEYCETQADRSTREQRTKYSDFYNKKIKKAFIELDGKFVPYDPSLYSERDIVFFEREGHDINLSNSKSVSGGNPCTLTRKFYTFYALAFIAFFSFLHFIVYPLIKPKNL